MPLIQITRAPRTISGVLMRSVKSMVKFLVPQAMLASYRNARLRWDMARVSGQTRKDVFADIYKNNRWGGTPGTYNSGSGSRAGVTAPYVSTVRSLIHREGVHRIVDLGCGDFAIGQQLL